MGESGMVALVPGVGAVTPAFEERGMAFEKEDEQAGPAYYRVDMADGDGGNVTAEVTASACLLFSS